MSHAKRFDEKRVKEGRAYIVEAPDPINHDMPVEEGSALFAPTSGNKPTFRENCGECVWIGGCISGTCPRNKRGVRVETHPAAQQVIDPIVQKANESLIAKLSQPRPKVLDGSTPLIHARRNVVKAVLALAHFETRFGQGGDQLRNRKADLEMALIEYENELLRRAP